MVWKFSTMVVNVNKYEEIRFIQQVQISSQTIIITIINIKTEKASNVWFLKPCLWRRLFAFFIPIL